jgi:hypothetical protein
MEHVVGIFGLLLIVYGGLLGVKGAALGEGWPLSAGIFLMLSGYACVCIAAEVERAS